MSEQLVEFIKKIQTEKRLNTLDVAATKQGVVLRILSFLGWDPFNVDEIHPEYNVGRGRVAFSLRQSQANKVFIDLKKVGDDLEEHHEELLRFSFECGVKIAIMTNGLNWWFSLPLLRGDDEDKRFCTIDMYEEEAEGIVQKLTDFLSKQNVVFGKALKKAESTYESRKQNMLMRETLPKAWNKVMSKPEEWLAGVVADVTKEMCGHRPDDETVRRFIASRLEMDSELSVVAEPETPSPPKPIRTPAAPANYTGKSISSFTLDGRKYVVNSWKEMLMRVCEIMLAAHKDKFEYVLTLEGQKRPYFTKNPKELLTGERIPGTDIYVESNLSAMGVFALSKRILALFGYRESDLLIEAS